MDSSSAARQTPKRLGWHQDSGRVNRDLEGDPRPRISLKVAFFLTDTSVAGRGNFSVVPGSHRRYAITQSFRSAIFSTRSAPSSALGDVRTYSPSPRLA